LFHLASKKCEMILLAIIIDYTKKETSLFANGSIDSICSIGMLYFQQNTVLQWSQ